MRDRTVAMITALATVRDRLVLDNETQAGEALTSALVHLPAKGFEWLAKEYEKERNQS